MRLWRTLPFTPLCIAQASGLTKSGADDSCYFEFTYAWRRKGEAMIIPVVMEASCRNTATWSGLGKLRKTFVDLSGGAEAWDAGLPRLVRHIKAALAVAGGARRRRTVARVGLSFKPRATRMPTQEPRERTPPRDPGVARVGGRERTPSSPGTRNAESFVDETSV